MTQLHSEGRRVPSRAKGEDSTPEEEFVKNKDQGLEWGSVVKPSMHGALDSISSIAKSKDVRTAKTKRDPVIRARWIWEPPCK